MPPSAFPHKFRPEITGRIKPGDPILGYSIGSVSTAFGPHPDARSKPDPARPAFRR